MATSYSSGEISANVGRPTVLSDSLPQQRGALAQRAAFLERQLNAEREPGSVLEGLVVRQLSRSAAGSEFAWAAENATVEFASNGPAAAAFSVAGESQQPYLAAVSSGLLGHAARYRAGHERGFLAALRALHELRSVSLSTTPPRLFADEDQCVDYLAAWQSQQPWQCLHCGLQDRYRLRSRARFECKCGRQHSVREGTVFGGSRAPLFGWFALTVAILIKPDSRLADLSQGVPVVRRATLRKMAETIKRALNLPERETLLAGLPGYVLAHLLKASSGSNTTRALSQHCGRNDLAAPNLCPLTACDQPNPTDSSPHPPA